MRHARDPALDTIEPLLAELRKLPGLTEKKRGTFYRKARAFLHFHEDPAGTFADIRGPHDGNFERYDVTEHPAQRELVERARRLLG